MSGDISFCCGADVGVRSGRILDFGALRVGLVLDDRAGARCHRACGSRIEQSVFGPLRERLENMGRELRCVLEV